MSDHETGDRGAESAPVGGITRRTALKVVGATLGAAAFAKAIAPIATNMIRAATASDAMRRRMKSIALS